MFLSLGIKRNIKAQLGALLLQRRPMFVFSLCAFIMYSSGYVSVLIVALSPLWLFLEAKDYDLILFYFWICNTN